MSSNKRSNWFVSNWYLILPVFVLLFFIAFGTVSRADWTGFFQGAIIEETRHKKDIETGDIFDETIKYQSGKTVWDWLDLIAVPVVIAILGYWFQQIDKQKALIQANRDEEAANTKAKLDERIARNNLSEEIIETYLDRMSDLLLNSEQREKIFLDNNSSDNQNQNNARDLVRIRTTTVLRRLEGDIKRQERILQFLDDADLSGFILKNANLSGINLDMLDITGHKVMIDLEGANLKGADLNGAKMWLVNLKEANLKLANLEKADLELADLEGANLNGINLKEANLEGANLKSVDLNLARLEEENLKSANKLRADDLKKANLEGANLKGANLKGADLNGANLKGANLEKINLEGVDMSGTDLKGVNLEGANLEEVNLAGVNMEGANLKEANLNGADLEGANLKGVNLKSANLEKANLKSANLNESDLEGANLKEANLGSLSVDCSREDMGVIPLKTSLINVINLTSEQIKLACNWEEAEYKIDESKNQEYIGELKRDKSSDPKNTPDCSWCNN